MPEQCRVSSRMVEFLRLGDPVELLSPSRSFIRTMGSDGLTKPIAPTITHQDLDDYLYQLRYDPATPLEEVEKARAALAEQAARFLSDVPLLAGDLVQIDLVTSAAELWALPFEALYLQQDGWLKSARSGVELTRRIRLDGFAEERVDWPDQPRILFLHAPKAEDLGQDLIDAHIAGLEEALRPWSRGKDAQVAGLLVVNEAWSAEEMAAAVQKAAPTYVHVLAHGAPIAPDPRRRDRVVWGLRLSTARAGVIGPADIADALAPAAGRPFVVTLAACDSGNQTDSVFGGASLAQELHRRGVPVVVGSQFPLSQQRSPILARAFYTPLCRGADVRVALHAARVELKDGDNPRVHDWLSLVGYVRLPEGYAAHLRRVRLRSVLGMLDAQQQRMEQVIKNQGPLDALDDVERLVRQLLQSLEEQRVELEDERELAIECDGLQASTCKRLAELRFLRGPFSPQTVDEDQAESRRRLAEAAQRYRTVYESNIHSHWTGVQHLSLEGVVNGVIEHPELWDVVHYAAARERDRQPLNYWPSGTLMELYLLCPLAGREVDANRTCEAVRSFRERVGSARAGGDVSGADFAISSTSRQLTRYVRWWTKANGFFPGRDTDLAADAQAILAMLEEA